MEPSVAAEAAVETSAYPASSTIQTQPDEPTKPAEAPSGGRIPPPNVPPVAAATGDGDEGGQGGESDGLPRGGIVRRIYLGKPPEEVWRWLVHPEFVGAYHLASLRTQPTKVGDPMQFTHHLAGHLLIDGEVLEWVERRRLVYSYTFLREEPEPPSRVSIELLRYGDSMCRLELRHDDLVVGGETWSDVDISWDIVLSSLKTWVETGRALPWPGRGRLSEPLGFGTDYP